MATELALDWSQSTLVGQVPGDKVTLLRLAGGFPRINSG